MTEKELYLKIKQLEEKLSKTFFERLKEDISIITWLLLPFSFILIIIASIKILFNCR